MKGFIKRISGLILLFMLSLPLLGLNFTFWLIRGKGSERIDKFMDWVVFDLMES